MKESMVVGRNIGALIGIAVFLIFGGFLISSTYGGYAGLTLFSTLGITSEILARAMVALSMIMGVLCGAFVSIVSGGVIGTTLGWFNSLVFDRKHAYVHE